MSHSRIHRAAVLLFGLLATQGAAVAQTIERVSVSDAGLAANADVDYLIRPTDDGRSIVFCTVASNLIAGDVPNTFDMFLRDRSSGTTRRIAAAGLAADITRDGRLVSYSHLTNHTGNLIDLVANTDTPLTPPGIVSFAGPFSGDGRMLGYMRIGVAFGSFPEAWRRELASGTDDLVSATWNGTPLSANAYVAWLSQDGSIVTFTTADPNMIPGDTNARSDAFYKDYGFGFLDRYSLDSTEGQLAGESSAGPVTPDTRFLVYSTTSPAIPADTNGTWDVYVADRFLGDVHLASVSSTGAPGNASTQTVSPWISVEGDRVIFDSLASNLVPGDANGARDVFEHDLSTGVTRRIVMGLGGAEPDRDVDLRGVSTDGRYLTVISFATNLVGGAPVAERQAYLVDRGPQCFVTSYCTANPNSTGVPASIQYSGTPSLSSNNFVLSGLDLPASTVGLFFHGTGRVDPPVPFGDGLRCVGGAQQRLGALSAINGVVIQFQDLNSPAYAGVQPGDVRRFQLLYRDPAAGGAGFNTTAALEVTFCP